MMARDNEWVIVFYVDENGCSYVQEFLQSLDIKTQARFAWSMEQLRVRNVRAQEPLVRHLEASFGSFERKAVRIFIGSYISFFLVVELCSYMASRRRHRRLLVVRLR